MDTPSWNKDAPYVTTPSIIVADALALSLEKVRLHAQRMEQAMEKEDVRLVLKAASDMLAELSTGHNPKNYSNLYAEVFTHLQQLPFFFQDYVAQGHDTYDSLYCVTQHAGHVLPRLYLMIVCASCAIKHDPQTVATYLSDLLDFCKGIQNPMRGLFLRSFLNTSVRSLLPDAPEPEDESDDPADIATTSKGGAYDLPVAEDWDPDSPALISINFLLRNFSEMNKLWTRMQRNLPQSDARDVIRTQLAELVGKNLNQLAGLGGLTFSHYQNLVLPCITEQIVQCQDKLAQRFLMEILVMSFPDKYHVHTLRELLDTCLLLQPGVELDKILSALIGRMTDHAARCPAAGPIADQSAFHMFLSAARESGIRHTTMPSSGVVKMFTALADYVVAVHGGDDELFNGLLNAAHESLTARGPITDPEAETLLLELLQRPLQDMSLDRMVRLENFAVLMHSLQPAKQRQLAAAVVAHASEERTDRIRSAQQMAVLARMVQPLISADSPAAGVAEDERSECLGHLATLARCIDTSDVVVTNAVVTAFRDALGFMTSSEPLEALGHVLLRAYSAADPATVGGSIGAHIGFMHSTIAAVLEDRRPAAAVRLLLCACEMVAARGEPEAAEAVLRAALAVYERRCALPPASQTCLAGFLHCLRDVRQLPEQVVRDIAARLRRYATSLPAHLDRVGMLCALAHVYWNEPAVDADAPAPLRDAAAVQDVLEAALAEAAHAEAMFRGEAWRNPASLYLTILDACYILMAAGSDTGAVQERATAHVTRLADAPCESVGVLEPLACWDEDLQARWESMQI